MANNYFQFKQFTVYQDSCAMKVCTDACLFGAWLRDRLVQEKMAIENALDIGTGTGLLSMMLAQGMSVAQHIDALEINEAAATQALENIRAANMAEKVFIHPTAMQSFMSEKKYDLIFSNPPFFSNDLKGPDNNRTLAMHETTLQLNDIITYASNCLSTNGRLALLLPFTRKSELLECLKKSNFYPEYVCDVSQTSRHDKFRIMMIASKKENSLLEEHITIKLDDGNYSEAFVRLLKDFYLHL